MKNLWQRIFGSRPREKKSTGDKAAITQGDLEPLLAEAERLRAPFIGFAPQTGRDISRADESCLGGQPWWPEGSLYPTAADGRPMVFLGQINFADMPALEDFPDRGLLQVFVEDGDVSGCNFPSLGDDGFRIAYWTETADRASAQLADRPEPECHPFQDSRLLHAGVPLAFRKGTMRAPCDVWQIDSMLQAFWHRDPDDVIDGLCEELAQDRTHPHYSGGHPRFTQFDIRSKTTYSDYEAVLLQLGWDELIMWGDAGEASFLIRRDDLRKRDFTKCLYNWDCC